ncbi:30S ribosomal protein S13 [Candidatus Bathyarchaeota archaeon]|nr:30S ribosomal protein S13 [Candidatus Bathyarchaeota archaeon]
MLLSEDYRHILRIRGTDIAGSERVAYGLVKIKGLSVNLASVITHVLGIEPKTRAGNLSDKDVQRIEDFLGNPKKYGVPSWYLNRRKDRESGEDLHDTGPDLTLRNRSDIERLRKIQSWRGVRHMLGLKVRGQHTRTTGRTGRSVGVSRSAVRRTER